MTLTDSSVVILQAQSSVDFLEQAFDCYARGQVFAIARPDTDLQGYGVSVTAQDLPATPRTGWVDLTHEPSHSDAPAQIVFTSGTEGRPKPIVLSHRNLADVVERLNAIMGLTDQVREYIGVPVTYSFGLGRARAVAAVGGRAFLPERFDPREIRSLLEADEINAISAVPSLWQVILAHPQVLGPAAEKVRWIEIGSQFMSADDKRAMRQIFPNARIVQHYGLTEASRSTFLDITDDSADLDSVGVALGDVALRLGDDNAICIAGPHVALGQLQEGGAIKPLADADGWLVTKDRGELKGDALYYHGRLDDQINVAGVKLGAEGFEDAVTALVPAASGALAVTALPDKARGEIVLLALEGAARDHRPLVEAAAEMVLTRRNIAPKGALRVIEMDSLPRTGTHKIQRRLLRDHLADEKAPAPVADVDLTDGQARIAGLWRRVLATDGLTADSSFYDAGGDSLSSVEIGLVMESAGVNRSAVNATLQGRALGDVARLADSKGAPATAEAPLGDTAVRNWAVSCARGLMVLSVLMSHWGPGLFDRIGSIEALNRWFSVILRMGTPGFAAVFGIGIGAFMLPGFATRRTTVLGRLRRSFWLVTTGLCLLSAAAMIRMVLQGLSLDGRWISVAFHGVLAFYMLALLTARLWLPGLARLGKPLLALPLIALALWLGLEIARTVLPGKALASLLEWPRLMLLANYSVFKMGAITCGGIMVGVWLAQQSDLRAAGRTLLLVGGGGVTFAVLTILPAYGYDSFAQRGGAAYISLPGSLMYLSIATMMVGGFIALFQHWHQWGRLARWPVEVLVVTGALALPIYVFHGLVIPIRDILWLLGVPGAVALLVPLGVFLGGMAVAGWRLYRLYFNAR